MTSSDRTVLDPGAVAACAARAGTSIVPEPHPAGRLGLVCGQFNGGITARLLEGALDALDVHGPGAASATIVWVPGAFELPLAAQHLARGGSVDAIVALGAVIRGETAHFDYVAGSCASGLARVGLDDSLPVVFGVLATDTVEQALERSEPGRDNKGYEAATGALQMVALAGRLGRKASGGAIGGEPGSSGVPGPPGRSSTTSISRPKGA